MEEHKDFDRLLQDIDDVIKNNYSKTLEVEKYPKHKELVNKINQIILDYKKYKSTNVKFKSMLMEDAESISNFFESFGSGNLNVEPPEVKLIELSNISYGITQGMEMVKNLKSIIDDIKKMVAEISSSSTEIASTNEEITLKANEEINLVSEASSTVTELTASIRQVADNANKVSEKSNESLKTVKDEYKHIGETINKIRETNKIVQKASEDLMKLNESATKIQDILNIINKIGEKTDLLALNAAIEASGAGEAGKRFRVVADEMRRLADNTIKSSKEIEEVLTTIQKGIGDNVDLMKNNVKEMAEVMLEMDKIGETMKNIVQTFEEAVGLMKEVSLATNQQAEGAEMFSNVIEQVNVAANDTVKGIENSQIAIEKFLEISNRLKEIVDRFKV